MRTLISWIHFLHFVQEPNSLPPLRDRQHQLGLVSVAILPNSPLSDERQKNTKYYKNENPNLTKDIFNQV